MIQESKQYSVDITKPFQSFLMGRVPSCTHTITKYSHLYYTNIWKIHYKGCTYPI